MKRGSAHTGRHTQARAWRRVSLADAMPGRRRAASARWRSSANARCSSPARCASSARLSSCASGAATLARPCRRAASRACSRRAERRFTGMQGFFVACLCRKMVTAGPLGLTPALRDCKRPEPAWKHPLTRRTAGPASASAACGEGARPVEQRALVEQRLVARQRRGRRRGARAHRAHHRRLLLIQVHARVLRAPVQPLHKGWGLG